MCTILVVIIVEIVFIHSFFFYCLLCNHSFPTNPNSTTNLYKLLSFFIHFFNFSTFQLFNYIAPASSFLYTFYSLGRQRFVYVDMGERKYETIEEIVFRMFQLTDTQKQRQRREIFASQWSQVGYLAVHGSHQSNAWLATHSIVTIRERAKNTNGSM